MTTIFMVTNNRADRALCLTKEEALRRIELHLDPGGEDLKLLHLPGAMPELEAHGLQGSLAHKLRFIANRTGAWLDVSEHDPDRAVSGFTTLVCSFDFNTGFDPSYEVQKRLYALQLGGQNVENLAEDLRGEITTGLRIIRDEYGHDLKVIKQIERAAEFFDGENIIPTVFADAAANLDNLVDIVVDRFTEKANTAFPQIKNSP
jgi:hypothetical protein